ncbi:MAG TPA: URC4/urg3 family protein [Stellaceae bacterium]|nr:URC4/urg3 family protein [Stellaceae bacterium]
MSVAREQAEYLLSAAAVRERCALLLATAERGATAHFRVVPERLPEIARLVASITWRRYSNLVVPPHSRWRHFAAGGIERADLVAPGAAPDERARARIDLAIVSVLLDAGAGPRWRYHERENGQVLTRSEGLAVASLRAMQQGLFSADPAQPWRADAARLAATTPEALGAALQHGPGNELAGLEGRAGLLRSLGAVATGVPTLFGREGRLGRLYDYWLPRRAGLPAPAVLHDLLRAFGAIWPGRLSLGGMPLGDCWPHSAIPGDGLVPLHKLSQWLAYSLIEPLAEAGFSITELDGLTGLAEYRNGGLFIDGGVLVPCDPELSRRPLDPASEPVVEWRALTVALLDRLAPLVRRELGVDPTVFPLAGLLEGGSWAAGRELAFARRPDGSPPLTVVSDGTLF